MSVDDMSVGDMSVDDMSVDDMSFDDMSVDEMARRQMSRTLPEPKSRLEYDPKCFEFLAEPKWWRRLLPDSDASFG